MYEAVTEQKMLLEREHYKYYLMLEKRFLNSLQYVNLSEDNFRCYSMEFASLLLLIGSELDSVFKKFCCFDVGSRKTIHDYAQYFFNNNFSNIVGQIIYLNQYNITIQPFKDWNPDKPGQSLKWWRAFTDIKHNRSNNLCHANLQNVLNILGALFFIEMLLLKKLTENTNVLDVFSDRSNLFLLKDWTSKAIPNEKVIEYLTEYIKGTDLSSFKYDVC